MTTGQSTTLRDRARLDVGRRFLMWRPLIVGTGGVINAALLSQAEVEPRQRAAVAAFFGFAVAFFAVEAWWLRARPLSERWLGTSLLFTTTGLTVGAALTGATASPLLPLLFAPAVVGFAAFGRSRRSVWLFTATAAALVALTICGPVGFAALPAPWGPRMVGVSACVALTLLATGVVGLVDAEARVSLALDALREDAVARLEKHALDVDHFGARVAHEVKNPLTAVRALVQLVRRKVTLQPEADRLERVEREVDRALETLESYLRFAKPVSDLERRPTPVAPLLAEVVDLVEARAQLRRLAVSSHAGAETIDADPRRIRDALLNLALNAIAATGAGGRVTLRSEPRAEGPVLLVEDTGRGMTAEELASAGRAVGPGAVDGHGLGLVIARGIFEAHGARLSFESSEGRGTTARVEFPR